MRVETVIAAVGTALLATAGALYAVWDAADVQNFSDVPPTVYGKVGLTFVITFVTAYQQVSARRVVARAVGKEDPYPTDSINTRRVK